MGKNKLLHNYGWVQNTSSLSTVRDTIDLIPEHGIKHLDLKEEIRKFRERKGNLPKRWGWDANCRIKAIHACGLVQLDRNIKGYVLTDYGRELKHCKKASEKYYDKRFLSEEEKHVYRESLLTNPPVIRVLELFNHDRRGAYEGLTKYDIGGDLGFVGDVGFTHLEPEWIAKNNYEFKNKEGSADKWARTIISWLRQVGWVEEHEFKNILGKKLKKYIGKEEIEDVLRYDARRIERIVPSEMLCSYRHPFPKLIQKRRIIILGELNKDQPVTISQLVEALKENGIEADKGTIIFEYKNLKRAGFRIASDDHYYKLDEKLKLDIAPNLFEDAEDETENEIEKMIEDMVVRYDSTIPVKLVDNLIRYGYTGESEFEGVVYKIFQYLGYDTEYFGQGKGRVADVIAKYENESSYAKSYGIIIDAKAKSDKYKFPPDDKRKMKEYIDKHGRELLDEHIYKHAFAFISSEFIDDLEMHLKEISKKKDIPGTAITVLNLLELANYIKLGNKKIKDLYKNFSNNSLFQLN